ncbi:MAG TPA: ABC transporter ATP-binding protein [Ktedonobacterales bacterium]|nr:ABC transporter ATP-binding protein [Ktedonobacterales bacterium]
MPEETASHPRSGFWPRLRRLVRGAPDFLTTLGRMGRLAWQAYPAGFLLLIATQILQGLIPLALAWITKVLFDLLAQSLQGHAPTNLVPTLALLLVLQALITIANQAMTSISQYFNAEFSRRLTLTVKSAIYLKVNSFVGLAPFEDPALYNTIQVASNKAQMAPIQTLNTCMILVQSAITLLSFLGILFALSPLLFAVLVLAALPQVYTQFKLTHRRVGVFVNTSPKERLAAYYGQVLSWGAFAKEMRLFQLGDYFLRKFQHTTTEIFRAQRQQQRRELIWQSLFALLESLVSVGAFVVVVVQAFSGRLSFGDVSLYISTVANVQGALAGIVMALSNMNEGLLFFKHYTTLLNMEQPLVVTSTPRPVPPLTQGIAFRDVSFRYSEAHPWTLRHVDLFLPANRCLALVGLNGAGKTTLVKLLARLYDPTEGQILWDGVDIREFDPQEYRQRLGAIFQDFSRYDLSVQENIGLGNVERVEDRSSIQKAAIKAGIHERIEQLPQSYQSLLSRWLTEKQIGVDFSGGEWQKLALARMFLRDAEMLVLDEPTAALDAQAEYDLYCHFKEFMQGHTCLLITHRFSTVRMADQIAILQDGHIQEHGTHDELLARAGVYAQLYDMQAGSYR